MKCLWMRFQFAGMIWICATGCGGTMAVTNTPISDACNGIKLSGTMVDSLTNQPVSLGLAVLETENQSSIVNVYSFSLTQSAASDVHGAFSLCSPALAAPSVIVLEALDSSGNAYPAFVASVSGAADLGVIPMGVCRGICGLQGLQQTSTPSEIVGTITSAPKAEAGSVTAQYAMNALDGSKNIWNLAISSLGVAQGTSFQTISGICANNAPFCATYSFTLPSQKPIQVANGGYLQASGAPTYSIAAQLGNTQACAQPSGFAAYQQGGTLPLTGAPGAQLSAANIAFTGCQ